MALLRATAHKGDISPTGTEQERRGKTLSEGQMPDSKLRSIIQEEIHTAVGFVGENV